MKRIFVLILSLLLTGSSFANHWEPDPHQFPTNMNVIGVIEINGIEQTNESLELGAFCGEECRGSQMLLYYEVMDRYMVFMTLFGEYGNALTFRLYNHDIQMELDLETTQTISYSSDAIIGSLYDPYVFAFSGGSTYTVTTSASPQYGGTVSGGGSFSMGGTCTVSAFPHTDYFFTGWKENGVTVSTDSEYTFVVASNRTLTAYFERISFTIEAYAMPEDAGVILGMGIFYDNEPCFLSATPNEHYTFLNWTEDGEVVSTDSEYSFPVTSNRVLIANFIGESYEISAESQPANGGNIIGTGQYEYGSMATLSAIPNGSRYFIDWRENGEVVSTQAEYTFQVTGNRHLVASFTSPYYEVEAEVVPAEGGHVEGTGIFDEGATCHLEAFSATGYSFVNWTENGEVVSTNSEYSFPVTSDRFLTANFLIDSYEITAESQPVDGGVINGTGQYEYGSMATLSAIPNGTQYFIDWKENGEVVSTQPDYSFQVTGNRHLVASFTDPYYVVEAEVVPAEGGYVEGTGSYVEGATCHLEAFNATGYTFLNWTEDGEVVSTEREYSFPVTSNRFLTANFLIDRYQITAESEPAEGGYVMGDGEYDYGSMARLSAVSNATYYFINWSEEGEVVSTQADYSFIVTGDRHLVATFAQSCYVVYADVEPAEGGTVEGAGNYIEGTTCRLEARPTNGYSFVGWFEDGEEVSQQLVYSFVVESDHRFVALFKIEYYEVTAIADPESGGEVYGMGTFTYGQTADLKVVPNENYIFLNWTEDGHVVSEDPVYSFEVVADRSLVAHFFYFDAVDDSEKTWAVYPNPTDGVVTIQGLPQSLVKVFDANGKLLLSKTVSEEQSLDLSGFSSGLYLLEIRSADGLHWQKVMKR